MVEAEGLTLKAKLSEEKVIAYCRIGCPHSDQTKETLNKLCSAKFSSIKIIDVENNDKSKKEATEQINKIFEKSSDVQKNGIDTYNVYPRVIFISSSGTPYFIGGNDKLQKILDGVKKVLSNKSIKDMLDVDIVRLCIEDNKLKLKNSNDIRLAHFFLQKLDFCKS